MYTDRLVWRYMYTYIWISNGFCLHTFIYAKHFSQNVYVLYHGIKRMHVCVCCWILHNRVVALSSSTLCSVRSLAWRGVQAAATAKRHSTFAHIRQAFYFHFCQSCQPQSHFPLSFPHIPIFNVRSNAGDNDGRRWIHTTYMYRLLVFHGIVDVPTKDLNMYMRRCFDACF